jgi:hypothetical protein
MNCCGNQLDSRCQPFPESGSLRRNTNLNLEQLEHELRVNANVNEEVYAYIVATVSIADDGVQFCQAGSAPNFQGGCITLCTCKHYMRSSRAVDDWRNVWVAGFTSHKMGRNYLFYLMQVGSSFKSFREIWNSNAIPGMGKRAKNASHSDYGDLFHPRFVNSGTEFSIGSYDQPTKTHRHWPNAWHNDIQYKSRSGNRAPLLIGNPKFSFLWTRPLISVPRKMPRGHLHYGIKEFLAMLMPVSIR